MDYSSWEKVEKIITCAFCEKLFDKPYTLICCHTFCESCINKMKKCPSCPNYLTGNELIPFNARASFENLYLSRVTIIFKNRMDILKGTCSDCITNPSICSNCYFVGCGDCERNQLCVDKSTNNNFSPVDINNPPENLFQYILKQVCTTHPDSKVTKYCYKCHETECEKCLTIHSNHDSDSASVQSVKENLFKYLASLEQHSDIQQMLHQRITDLQEHKESLHKLYENKYTSTEQSYDREIHSLCQKKQIVLSRLMSFWSVIDRAVENYKTEIQDLQKVTNDFHTYFVLLIEKSSNKEIIAYFKKVKKQPVVEKVAQIIEKADRKIQGEKKWYLQEKQILEKFNEQKEVIIKESFVRTGLSAVPHSRAGTAFKQEYQCLNYKDKLFKVNQIQVEILGEEHSMFTLPLAASKAVQSAKQQLMVVSKCAQCLNQLQLFSRALGGKYPELKQKEIAKSLKNYLLNSNKQLLSVTFDAITGIKKAISCLQIKNVSLYCEELKKNLNRLAAFTKKSDDYYTELEEFYCEQQKLHINHDQSAGGRSSALYISMLLDIMMDCRTYISNTRQICEKLFSIEKTIEILCKEGHEKESCLIYLGHANSNDSLKKLIASHGFQLQIVLHYSTWVALNEICKSTEELITCWNLDRVQL